jgi:hypothetical protein
VTDTAGVLGADVPAASVAATVKEYVVAAVKPVTARVVVVGVPSGVLLPFS